MGDGNGNTTLTLQDLTQIIATSKSAGTNPMLIGLQLFNGLGEKVILSGDILRQALSDSAIPVEGPLAAAVTAIQSITKVGSLVTLTNDQEVQLTLNGTRVRIKQELSFDVGESESLPALINIDGLSAHKLLWISIHSIQLKQNQEGWSVRVATSAATTDFALG